MDNDSLQKLRDLLEQQQTIGIAVGRNPKLDQMAAALGLYLSLSQAGKNVIVASATEPLVEVSSLVGIDKVKTALSSESGDLIVSFPYTTDAEGQGEIQKVSYTTENNRLNIIVKAGEKGLSFSEKDVKFDRSGSLPTLLFVIGTPRLSDLGNLFNPDQLKDTKIVNVDANTENQGFGDVVLVAHLASSVSEEMANLLFSLDFPLDIDTAQNLLLGIAQATDNFQHSKTSYLAFEMAGELMKIGAVRPKTIEPRRLQDASSFMPLQQQPIGARSSSSGQAASRSAGQRRDHRTDLRQSFAPRPQTPPRQQVSTGSSNVGQPYQGTPMRQQSSQSPFVRQQSQEEVENQETPPDWLTPKVYKSSTLG